MMRFRMHYSPKCIVIVCAAMLLLFYGLLFPHDYFYYHIISFRYRFLAPISGPLQSCQKTITKMSSIKMHLTTNNSTSSPRYSRIIHQTWRNAVLPSRFRKWSHSWHECYPDWRHILWTDEDNRCIVQEKFPWFLPYYDSLPSAIYRVDSVRYLYLWAWGGIYADLDAECLRPFHQLMSDNHEVMLGAMEGGMLQNDQPKEGYVQNSLMVARLPSHRLWKSAIRIIMSRDRTGRPEALTGPDPLMRAINSIREERRHAQQPDDIIIFPGSYFNPFSWNANQYPNICKDLNRMSDHEVELCRRHFLNSSFVIQYHTQVWDRGRVEP